MSTCIGRWLFFFNGRKSFFQIGERNITVLRKFLWKNNILLDKHDIGGVSSKTVKISVMDGNITVKTRGLERVL